MIAGEVLKEHLWTNNEFDVQPFSAGEETLVNVQVELEAQLGILTSIALPALAVEAGDVGAMAHALVSLLPLPGSGSILPRNHSRSGKDDEANEPGAHNSGLKISRLHSRVCRFLVGVCAQHHFEVPASFRGSEAHLQLASAGRHGGWFSLGDAAMLADVAAWLQGVFVFAHQEEKMLGSTVDVGDSGGLVAEDGTANAKDALRALAQVLGCLCGRGGHANR
jgi:hypothetical protein